MAISPNKIDFISNFSMEVWCKRENKTELPYEYCFTYDTEIGFIGDAHVNDKAQVLLVLVI